MAFWRTWIRALLGAYGVTLLVPAGLLLAVVLGATIGGGGLGGLGQLVSGPGLPNAQASVGLLPPTATVGGGVAALPVEPAGSRRPSRSAAASPGRSVSSSQPSGTGTKTGSGSVPKRKPQPTVTQQQPSQSVPKPPATTSPIGAVTAPVQAVSAPVKTTVQRIGAAAQKLLESVPIVGPPAADVVGTVVELLSGPSPRAAGILPR